MGLGLGCLGEIGREKGKQKEDGERDAEEDKPWTFETQGNCKLKYPDVIPLKTDPPATLRTPSFFFLIPVSHPLSLLYHGLRPQRRPPPLALPSDSRRRLVSSQRRKYLVRCSSQSKRWHVLLFFFNSIYTTSYTISIAAGFPEFRVFPYENANLEPFETAVAALNPVVAVKVRSAAVHAALAEVYVNFQLFTLVLAFFLRPITYLPHGSLRLASCPTHVFIHGWSSFTSPFPFLCTPTPLFFPFIQFASAPSPIVEQHPNGVIHHRIGNETFISLFRNPPSPRLFLSLCASAILITTFFFFFLRWTEPPVIKACASRPFCITFFQSVFFALTTQIVVVMRSKKKKKDSSYRQTGEPGFRPLCVSR